MRISFLCVSLVVFAACESCRTDIPTPTGCRVDADCAVGGSPVSAWRCVEETGECLCRTNIACLNGQFCNTIGYCQDRAGCQTNADCQDPTTFCDTGSGACITRGRCETDLQCLLGEVCNLKSGICTQGCRVNGDCPGTSCRCDNEACEATCTGTTPEELANCQIGVCDQYFCADKSFCRFGELCGVLPGKDRAECYTDYNRSARPYCDNCTFGGGTQVCGFGANYCLVDTRNGGQFCGADCYDKRDSCPNGYNCSDVIVVSTQWACGGGNGCAVNTDVPCSEDGGCPRGGTCVETFGGAKYCAPACDVDEGDTFGFCSCLVDSDCAQDTCSQGECTISRKACITVDDCRPVRCIDFAGAGGCYIGANCAPANGLSCEEVRPAQ